MESLSSPFYLIFKVHCLVFCTYYSTSSKACQEILERFLRNSLSLSAVRLSHFLNVFYHKQKQIASVKLHKNRNFGRKFLCRILHKTGLKFLCNIYKEKLGSRRSCATRSILYKKKRGKTPLLVGNVLNSVPDFEALGRRRPKRTGLALSIRTGTVNILADTRKHMACRSLKIEIHHNKTPFLL
nr:MAG TPA: hypothetical protein [Caudoviricetes sp.]